MFRLLLYVLAVTAILALIMVPVPALAEETEAQIDLHQSRGPVGTDLCMNGRGFEPDSEVVIAFKTKDNIVQTTYTDETGCFNQLLGGRGAYPYAEGCRISSPHSRAVRGV